MLTVASPARCQSSLSACKKYEQSVSGSEDMGYTVALTGGIGS
ncbi:TPA: dephospho-CoA kinase, partial [Klebsiella pneumoniae]|nr:dephospho-CoA kinase [Klebsiella pneumoniae]